jgi:hypothetical protein
MSAPYIRIAPVDPWHAWVFWTSAPDAARVVVTVAHDAGAPVLDEEVAPGDGARFVNLANAGLRLRATLSSGETVSAVSDPLRLPQDAAGPGPARFTDGRALPAVNPFARALRADSSLRRRRGGASA